MADPIADMFIRIKNAHRAGRVSVHIPYSKFKHEIAHMLKRAGMVAAVERKGKRVKKTLEITLKDRRDPQAFHDVAVLSTPSRRLYAPHGKLHPASRGGIVILSTSRGVMSEKEARKAKVGGQLIAEVW